MTLSHVTQYRHRRSFLWERQVSAGGHNWEGKHGDSEEVIGDIPPGGRTGMGIGRDLFGRLLSVRL